MEDDEIHEDSDEVGEQEKEEDDPLHEVEKLNAQSAIARLEIKDNE